MHKLFNNFEGTSLISSVPDFQTGPLIGQKRSDKNENRTHVVKLLFLVNKENVDGH